MWLCVSMATAVVNGWLVSLGPGDYRHLLRGLCNGMVQVCECQSWGSALYPNA